jgi:hypothetical protein
VAGIEKRKEKTMKIEMSTDLRRATIPSVVEAKIDGEFQLWDGKKLINRFGRERILPCCDNLPDIPLIGELYYGDGKANFYEALPYLKGNNPRLHLALFGIYDSELSYYNQMKELQILTSFCNDLVQPIKGITAYSQAEIEQWCQDFVSDGWEGAVIKPLHGRAHYNWIKYKPNQTLDLVVVALSHKKHAVAVGDVQGNIYGHCSLSGKDELIELLKPMNIVGRDREHYYIEPKICVEVLHLGIIGGKSLRSPRIKRIRHDKPIAECDVLY